MRESAFFARIELYGIISMFPSFLGVASLGQKEIVTIPFCDIHMRAERCFDEAGYLYGTVTAAIAQQYDGFVKEELLATVRKATFRSLEISISRQESDIKDFNDELHCWESRLSEADQGTSIIDEVYYGQISQRVTDIKREIVICESEIEQLQTRIASYREDA
jgi:hypothetical protein